jgi:hypothetical protein
MTIRTAPLAPLALLITLAACSAKPTVQTADNADKPLGGTKSAMTISEGSAVCVDQMIGQRYVVEDALSAAGLEPVDDCMSADVVLQESGDAGAYVLRYQMVGDAEWSTCESAREDQTSFLESCMSEMLGGSPVASAQ